MDGSGGVKVPRTEIDMSPGSPAARAVMYGQFAASNWAKREQRLQQESGDAPMTSIELLAGEVEEAIVHLLELGVLTLNADVVERMDYVPASRWANR